MGSVYVYNWALKANLRSPGVGPEPALEAELGGSLGTGTRVLWKMAVGGWNGEPA